MKILTIGGKAGSEYAGSPAQFSGAFITGETLFLILWSIFTCSFFGMTLRKNGCLMTVFGSLTITFALLAAGQHSPDANKAAGYVGFFCGSSAIYTAFAELYQEHMGFNVWGLAPVRFI